MLYHERAEFILQQLQLQSAVKVNELSQQLRVSVDTVRRDLKAMEQEGLIKCLRGGACLPESLMSSSNFVGREVINSDLKRAAARKAIPLIQEGDVIAMNSGTTNTILAQEMLSLNTRFAVVTNNFAAAGILMQNPSIQLTFIGGKMDALERSTYGAACVAELSQYYPDKCFLSINAVNYRDGYTDFRVDEIPVIRQLASSSRQVIAVMDSSKLGKCSKKKALEPEQVDLLLMDDAIREEIREKYADKGFRIE